MTMMVHAKLQKETQVKLWAEAVNSSGLLENLILKVYQKYPDMEAWNGNIMMNWFDRLVQFIIIWYVAKENNIKVKMTELWFPAIMVGCAENVSTGTYRMSNPDTKQVLLTCDLMAWI